MDGVRRDLTRPKTVVVAHTQTHTPHGRPVLSQRESRDVLQPQFGNTGLRNLGFLIHVKPLVLFFYLDPFFWDPRVP